MFWSVFVGLCAKRGVSPNAVAKELALSSGSVTSWKGGAIPRPTTIKKIADYFGVSPDLFLAETDDPSIKKAPTDKIDERILDAGLIKRLVLLTPDELRRVDDFVQGILASRKA